MNKWTRRGFIGAGLVAGGALVVGVAVRPGHRAPGMAALMTSEGESLLNLWVKIAPDNTVTVIAPHSEMGQGAQSALAQMLGDELDAEWSQIRFEEAPALEAYANHALARGFFLGDVDIPKILIPTVDGAFLKLTQMMDLQITGGSTSVRATGQYGLRVAGAAAREMLLEAAADAWGVSVDTLRTERSTIIGAGRQAPYAQFAEAAAQISPPVKPRLKTPDQYTLMGTSLPRLDIPAKVDGTAQFGIDAEVEGMVYATVLSSPVFGGRVASLDDAPALAAPGVRQVINLGDAVAVLADGYWSAKQALAQVRVEWDTAGNGAVSSEAIFAQFDADIATAIDEGGGDRDVSKGDVAAASAQAARTIEADYRVPYLAHATMEPLNATARFEDGICEVWTGNQNPLGYRGEVAKALDIPAENVRVNNFYMGGGFGRRSEAGVAIQAARLAREAGVPVKLIWSREEDIRQDRYRPAIASRFSAALDADGQPIAWRNYYVDKHEPVEAPHIPYAIANQAIYSIASPTHVPFGPWRSVDHSQHGFFTESFVDELAAAAGRDPFEFRRDLLRDAPRQLKVLETAAERADWNASLGAGRGRGIALQESFGTYVAQVVEVRVEDGELSVERVVCAVDPGFAISPDGLTAQMESGIIFGLTAALYGEISIADGAVRESNFHDYTMLRMNETPVIETHIINSGHPPGGAGEPGTPAVAPALANAIFSATGVRIRALPVKNNDLTVFNENA